VETTLLALIGLTLALLLWRDSLRAREAAVRICARACEGEGLQLLDQTVALIRLRPVLGIGRPRLRRVYAFEFSSNGADRHVGSVTMLGAHMESMHMGDGGSETPATPPGHTGNIVDLHRRH